jgi:hypothetical protein
VNGELAAQIQELGGDPTDEVWRWFALNGPHGSGFSWGQTRQQPPGYVGVEHLERIVAERLSNDPRFLGRLTAVVDLALSSTHASLLRRAVQVAAIIGGTSMLERVGGLRSHNNDKVAADARASVFYLKRKLRIRREVSG